MQRSFYLKNTWISNETNFKWILLKTLFLSELWWWNIVFIRKIREFYTKRISNGFWWNTFYTINSFISFDCIGFLVISWISIESTWKHRQKFMNNVQLSLTCAWFCVYYSTERMGRQRLSFICTVRCARKTIRNFSHFLTNLSIYYEGMNVIPEDARLCTNHQCGKWWNVFFRDLSFWKRASLQKVYCFRRCLNWFAIFFEHFAKVASTVGHIWFISMPKSQWTGGLGGTLLWECWVRRSGETKITLFWM